MKLEFDDFSRTVYAGLTTQNDLRNLQESIILDKELEILALWRIVPQTLGENIVPSQASGDERIDILLEALTNASGEGLIGRKRPLRYPGLVRVSRDTLTLAITLQASKANLKSRLLKLPDHQRKIFWGQFSDWTGLEALRDAVVIPRPRAISFYWQTGTSSECKSAAEWATVTKKKLAVAKRSRTEDARSKIDLRQRELAFLLDADPFAKFSTCRDTQPSVRARISSPNGGALSVMNASMPFLFYGEGRVKVRDLKCLHDKLPPGAMKKATGLGVKISRVPIVEGSQIFHYLAK